MFKKNKNKNALKAQLQIVENSRYFDGNWYLKDNPDVANLGKDPAKHYLKFGWLEGRNPGPKFNTIQYLQKHPNCKVCPLIYIWRLEQQHKFQKVTDKQLLIQSGLFNEKWYLKKYPEVARQKITPIAHFLKYGWKAGKNPSKEFNTVFYLNQYPGVRQAHINPVIHYIKYGMYEGRLPKPKYTFFSNKVNESTDYILIAKSEYFNEKWYLETYPEVALHPVDPVEHYLTIGWKEGKNPSEKFDGNDYLERYAGVKNKGYCPLLHYEKNGKYEGRVVKPISHNDFSMHFFKAVRFYCSVWYGKFLYALKFKKNKRAKILVCLHLFYMDAWPLIQKYLKNLSAYNYDLVITYSGTHCDESILDRIKKFKPDTQFYPYPDQGFDLGPFVDVMSKLDLKSYDIVFKLHSKGTHRQHLFIYHQIFKYQDWMFNLYDGILGGCSVHYAIDYLLNNKKIGLVAAENLIIEDPKHKNAFTQQIAKQHRIKINPVYHYVAGTIFACKTRALVPLIKKHYTIKDFSESVRGTFSFAHAIERIMCALMEKRGFIFQGIPTPHHKYTKEVCQYEKTSALRLLDDKRFILDYDWFYKTLETRRIYSYEIVKVPLKDINRRWMGNNYALKDTSVYAYLQGDRKKYQEYCDLNATVSKFIMSPERFDELKKSVMKSYNKKMMPVIAGENNIIQDGQHRLVLLLSLYGENHRVQCLKLYYQDPHKQIIKKKEKIK